MSRVLVIGKTMRRAKDMCISPYEQAITEGTCLDGYHVSHAHIGPGVDPEYVDQVVRPTAKRISYE